MSQTWDSKMFWDRSFVPALGQLSICTTGGYACFVPFLRWDTFGTVRDSLGQAVKGLKRNNKAKKHDGVRKRQYRQLRQLLGGTAPPPYHSKKPQARMAVPLKETTAMSVSLAWVSTARALYLLQSPTLAVPSVRGISKSETWVRHIDCLLLIRGLSQSVTF